MPKILFVAGWYPTEDKPSFGIFIRRHAETAALNNEVSVLYIRTISTKEKKILEIESGFRNNLLEVIISINKSKLLFFPLSYFLKIIFYIKALVKGYKIVVSHSGKPELVHANILYEGGRQAWLLKLLFGIPYICSEHWTGYLSEDGSYRGFVKKLFSKFIAAKAKFILPVSKHLAETMQWHGLKGNYSVVPNVVNTNCFHPDEQISKKNNQIIHVSSLDERQKNFSGILSAFQQATLAIGDLKLIAAGGEENITAAKKIITRLTIDSSKIIFAGLLSEPELVKVLSESALLIMFSNYENQPCVILEALACGIPVIASDVGGIKEIVNENNGILVEAGNENQLASAIRNMLDNLKKYPPEKLSEFINQNYSYGKVNLLLNKIYRESLAVKK